jgi:cytidyltransferase-like protein
MTKKVFVSGCFDLLHSGHIAFFQEASTYGDLYVALGSDKTVFDLKGRTPVNSEDERLFMVKSLNYVKDAFVSQGSGMLDFLTEFQALQPDIIIVNEDGNTPDKQRLCQEYGVEYIILEREPHSGLKPRTTTALRTIHQIPFRIDLAGGWLDQPYISQHYPGSVITNLTIAAAWPQVHAGRLSTCGDPACLPVITRNWPRYCSVTIIHPAQRSSPDRKMPSASYSLA